MNNIMLSMKKIFFFELLKVHLNICMKYYFIIFDHFLIKHFFYFDGFSIVFLFFLFSCLLASIITGLNGILIWYNKI